MGHKAKPKLLRLNTCEDWDNIWFVSKKDTARFIKEDFEIRKFLDSQLSRYSVSEIKINRTIEKLMIVIKSARTGIVLGKNGENVNRITKEVAEKFGYYVNIHVVEEKSPDTSPDLIAQNIANQLEKRIPFRRAMKQAIQQAMKSGAKGIKITCSGRLGGVEIARSETYMDGSCPLHTFRAKVKRSNKTARTIYGAIGISVLVNMGNYYPKLLPNSKN